MFCPDFLITIIIRWKYDYSLDMLLNVACNSENFISFSVQFSSVSQSCPTLCDSMDWSTPGFPVHGIFQARILEWVAISFSRRSSWPRDWTPVSHIAGRRFTIWATREVVSSKMRVGHPTCYFSNFLVMRPLKHQHLFSILPENVMMLSHHRTMYSVLFTLCHWLRQLLRSRPCVFHHQEAKPACVWESVGSFSLPSSHFFRPLTSQCAMLSPSPSLFAQIPPNRPGHDTHTLLWDTICVAQ